MSKMDGWIVSKLSLIDSVEFMLMVDFKNILEFINFRINSIEFMSI